MSKQEVGVLGATSLVGQSLLPLLAGGGWTVTAYSRHAHPGASDMRWRIVDPASAAEGTIDRWISAAPITVLPDYFDWLDAQGAKRIVAISSTSRFTKDASSDPQERVIAARLTDAETQLQTWARQRGVQWTILRPTLIYGHGRDRNVAEIARLIDRFGFFPLLGAARGLRQPVHADDVAGACVAALEASAAINGAYDLSGGETLSYREMVERIFDATGRRRRLLTLPMPIFSMAIAVLRILPRYRHWSAAMVDRMNRDLVFDHSHATADFGFAPRGFRLSADDIVVRR